MYVYRSYGLLGLLSLLLLAGCSKDEALMVLPEPEPVAIRTFPNADEQLWPYFERFEQEAARRGLTVDLKVANIEGLLEEIHEENVLGECSYSPRFPGRVTIDRSFWERANDRGREFVVFHELGHCELLRGHFEGTFADGTCESLMRSGVEGCRDNYREATRTAYLDELFDPARMGDWFDQ
ncbi:hypothetical protein [Flavilitoribacter nigricans]|uniref:Uncharacterized protein n=1 Tax=Flavilitoribacter nigricans (strain ATCC 23147 / DSM 23189 / NBRC 102662 / NCIMB 1420 / SS-2) TaxID=1122177 RepID=A0A2D0NCI3_FLAN2|nr:hypothetical protein [Flavilitoribacter nigricans]PHN06108.1 hypothetical protein CRP01_14165 [Flavilitoribacter nigricans DSM 23189 = NBRC 102662]